MLKTLTGSISEEMDMDITEILIILQDQKDLKGMIFDYESKKMSASEEIDFLQYIFAAGIVWLMPDTYIKRVQDALKKGIIYFN